MKRENTPIPEPVAQLQRQLEQFRSTQPRRTKLPESLWQAAVELARQHGVYPVAHPFSGCVFVFRSRSGTSIRLLSYDGQGYWLAQKRLSKGRFVWWPEATGTTKPLEAYEAQLLMAAGDVSKVRAAPMWRRVGVLK